MPTVHKTKMLASVDVERLRNYRTISDDDAGLLKNSIRRMLQECSVVVEVPDSFEMGVARVPQNPELDLVGWNVAILGEPEWHSVDINVDGSLNAVFKLQSIDLGAMRKQCQLKPFPVTLPGGQLHYDDEGHIHFNCERLQVRNLHDGDVCESHEPLHPYEGFHTGDCVILMPRFNQDEGECLALLLNRYAWGMNVNVAYFHPKSKTIYCWGSYNFDHPCGEAIRCTDEGAEIFLHNDDTAKRTLLYSSNKPLLPCLDHFFGDSHWRRLPIARDFQALYNEMKRHNL